MLNVDTFLHELSINRRLVQSAALSHISQPDNRCSIPPALDLVLEKGGLIQPQLARSPFAPSTARVGVPTADRKQIENWFACYGEDTNWLLDTEASGIIALEFSRYFSPYMLFRRPGEYQVLEHTLRFNAHRRIFALFANQQRRRIPPGRYHGVHWRSSVLIPPSRVLDTEDGENEVEYCFVDASAPLLPAPESLFDSPAHIY